MNRTLVSAAAAAAVSVAGCGGSDGPVSGDRAFAHVEKMLSHGPRPPGSAALQQVGDYLAGQIQAAGLEPRVREWDETIDAYGEARTYHLRNIWTVVPGRDHGDGEILLIGAHYDSKLATGHPDDAHNLDNFVGAIDGVGASAVLLELARVLQTRQNVPDVWLCWFDGEECIEWDWVTEKALLGSRHFARTMHADQTLFPKGLAARMRAMILLDLIGSKNLKIDRDSRSSATLNDIFQRAAESMGEGDRMYRWVSPMTDDHEPFKNLGVTVIDLIDFRFRVPGDRPRQGEPAPEPGRYTAWWHTEQDDITQMDPASLGFVGNLVWHALPEIEAKLFAK